MFFCGSIGEFVCEVVVVIECIGVFCVDVFMFFFFVFVLKIVFVYN